MSGVDFVSSHAQFSSRWVFDGELNCFISKYVVVWRTVYGVITAESPKRTIHKKKWISSRYQLSISPWYDLSCRVPCKSIKNKTKPNQTENQKKKLYTVDQSNVYIRELVYMHMTKKYNVKSTNQDEKQFHSAQHLIPFHSAIHPICFDTLFSESRTCNTEKTETPMRLI